MAGHEVHMVTSWRHTNSTKHGWFTTNEAGIHVHWYPVPYSNHMSYAQRIKAFLSFAVAARSKAVSLNGDVIFATSTPLTIALPAVPASRKHKVPLVFEVRDLWPEMPIAMGALKNPVLRYAACKLEHWAYHNSAAVVALSPGMKQGVVKTGYAANRVVVIPNSSDNAEFAYNADAAHSFRQQRPWLGGSPLLVYAGTFGRVNGVGYMVELARALHQKYSDIKILLVGDGQERSAVIKAAQQAGVYKKNLYFEEAMPKKNIPALLSAATMASNLVTDLPQAGANSANKFFDTLAAGKPILLNHGGWMHDLVEKHGCGVAMWRKPLGDVAVQLDAKLHDAEWLKKAGIAAGRLAEEVFARDKLAGQLMQVLESAVAGEGHRAESIAAGNF